MQKYVYTEKQLPTISYIVFPINSQIQLKFASKLHGSIVLFAY